MFHCGFIHAHPAASAAIGMFVLNCFAGSLPRPVKGDPKSYVILFGFTHAVVGQIPRICAVMLPPQWAKFFTGGGATPAPPADEMAPRPLHDMRDGKSPETP